MSETTPDPIESIRSGDASVFGSLYTEHARDIWAFCRSRGACADDCDDLTSTTFLLAWRTKEKAFEVDGSTRPWLFGIANNVLRNESRSLRRFRAAVQRAGADLQDEPDHAESAIRELNRFADNSLAAEAMASLSQDHLAVVRTVLVDGHSTASAAAAMKLPEGTVKSRLARAREQMRAFARKSEERAPADPGTPCGHLSGKRHLAVAAPRTVTR